MINEDKGDGSRAGKGHAGGSQQNADHIQDHLRPYQTLAFLVPANKR